MSRPSATSITKTGGEIRVADLALGLKILLAPDRQRTGRPAILLCGCRNEATCHRAVIAEALRGQGILAEALNWEAEGSHDERAARTLAAGELCRTLAAGELCRTPVTGELCRTLERLHEYVIRLRCEDPPKRTRAQALVYLQAQTDKLASESVAAGGTNRGWPDPADVLADGDQLDGLREAVEELTRPDAPYPVPLPAGCGLLPTANFDVFAAGRLYNGKVTDNGTLPRVGASEREIRA